MLAGPAVAKAQWRGEVSVEGRAFTTDAPGWARTEATLETGFDRRLDLGWGTLALGGFVRVDPADPARNRIDLSDLALSASLEDVDITVGIGEVFWGVLETAHLVDVINQRDVESRWPRYGKLGQPLIAASWMSPWGAVELYALPWARDRSYAGRRGRVWSDARVDASAGGHAVDRPGQWAWAARWALTSGAWDVGASYFWGPARDPLLQSVGSSDSASLVPVYGRVRQLGADIQLTGVRWLWKLEVVSADPASGRYLAVGSGVEVVPAPHLAAFVECLFDSRGREGPTSWEHDVFFGTRLLYQDGRAVGGASVDFTTGNVIGALELERRVGAAATVTLVLRAFAGRAGGEPPLALREETTVSLRLRRHF